MPPAGAKSLEIYYDEKKANIHILKQFETEKTALIKKFIKTQMKSPKKKDWINTIFMNLNDLEMLLTFDTIDLMPIARFQKVLNKGFYFPNNKKKIENGKVIEIYYLKHEMLSYLKSEDINIDERKLILQLGIKINSNVKSHF